MNAEAPATVREWVDYRAAQAPQEIFLIAPETDREVSNLALQQALAALKAPLADWHTATSDIVAVMAGNSWAAAQLFLGCLYHARVFLPLNLAAGDGQIAYALEHSGARLLIADENNRQRADTIAAAVAQSSGADIRVVEVGADEGLGADALPGSGGDKNDEDSIPAAADRGLLIYTSGTSGRPKGVLHTHTSALAGGLNVMRGHELRRDDRALCVLPLYHINGLCVTVLAPLVCGGSVVLPQRFSAGKFWQWAKKYRCTWLSVVPTQIAYLLNAEAVTRAPTVRFARSASAPLPADVLRQFETRFAMPMLETMGLTETAAPILANPPPPRQRKPGSPGLPCGCEVTLLDGEGKEIVAANSEGEIAVRGDNVMCGYLNNPAANDDSFTSDGWLLTGDLAKRDADGYFYVSGRRKELIIKGGENIAPREIDEALIAGGGILEAAAFARPCPTYGQTVEAAVVIAAGCRLSADDLIARCKKEVGDFRAPSKVHFLAELPKGPSGKIQRLRLAAMITADGEKA